MPAEKNNLIMKKILTIIVLLFISVSFGQVAVKKSTISSGGEISTNGNITVISNVGEVAIQENSQGNILISEGFISPEILQTTGVSDYTMVSNIRIYPNPAVKYVNILMEKSNDYEIILMDMNGKELLTRTDNTQQFQIDLSAYQNATYLLIVKNISTKQYQVFKLIKA